jgi:methionyl aminopeptidase
MIILKSADEIREMHFAGRIVAETLNHVRVLIEPGVSTKELDKAAENYIKKCGAKPAFKGYRGYPASTCISLNEVVVHGIPDESVLRNGDIVGIDVGVEHQGYYSDIAATFPVGRIDEAAARLIRVTREALEAGIAQCRPGKRLFDISHAIQEVAEKAGFSPVRQFVGHGIGRAMHEDPQIPNFGEAGTGPVLKEGMVFALEPMINAGGWEVEVMKDGWTVKTVDRSLSAHFEHTVVITKSGPLILTLI